MIRPPNSATVAVVEMPPGFPALKIAFAVIGLVAIGVVLVLIGRMTATSPTANTNATSTVTPHPPRPTPTTVAAVTVPTPEPTKQRADRPRPKPSPTPDYYERYMANQNRLLSQADPRPRYKGHLLVNENGDRLRAICKNGKPSYWQLDRALTCMANGGVQERLW